MFVVLVAEQSNFGCKNLLQLRKQKEWCYCYISYNRVREKYLLSLAEVGAKNALMPAHLIVIIFLLKLRCEELENYSFQLFTGAECSVVLMNLIFLLNTKSSICLFTNIQLEKGITPYPVLFRLQL